MLFNLGGLSQWKLKLKEKVEEDEDEEDEEDKESERGRECGVYVTSVRS